VYLKIDSSTPAVFTIQPSSAMLPYRTAKPPSLENAFSAYADVYEFYRSSPGGVPTQVAFSQNRYYSTLDGDREKGVYQ
jgi:hypothetical protein